MDVTDAKTICTIRRALIVAGAPIYGAILSSLNGIEPFDSEEVEMLADEAARVCVALINEKARAGWEPYHAPGKEGR